MVSTISFELGLLDSENSSLLISLISYRQELNASQNCTSLSSPIFGIEVLSVSFVTSEYVRCDRSFVLSSEYHLIMRVVEMTPRPSLVCMLRITMAAR